MGIAYNTSIVRDGLIFHLDAMNPKCTTGGVRDLRTNLGEGSFIGNCTHNNDVFEFPAGSGNIIMFDGIDSFLNPTSSYTTEIYANISAPSDVAGLVHFGSNVGSFLWGSGSLGVQTNGTNNGDGYMIPYNEWVHLVTMVDFTNGRLIGYVNGELLFDVPTSDTDITIVGQVYIGARSSASYNISGLVSDAKIYNRPLTQSEVKRNFNALVGRYGA